MTDPSRHIDELRDQFTRDLEQAGAEAEVRAVRDRYLSRKSGLVSGLLRTLGSAPPEDRPRLGQLVNRLKADIDERLAARLAAVASARPPKGSVDVTLPGRVPAVGHRHPLSILREEIEGIFTRYGFLIIEGPELEDDYHNFEALNMPPEHPARDMQDTLYLGDAVRSLAGAAATLLRTHTSGMQIRHMETHPPPVRLIAPGRVYRRDNFDLTHTPMFTQVEGLVVGETVTLADLKGTLTAFAHELFGAERRVRFRPSFFPYTEPSAELDISCAACGGTGQAAKPDAASTVRPVPVESAPMSSGRGAVPPEPAPMLAGRGRVPPEPTPTLAGRGRASTEPAQTLAGGGGGTPGCAMCKRTGWLEILGSGMVHPAVFEAVGYDPEQYTGFAFGMGIERAALLKWGVEDIRLFYENDLRFLEQFPL